MYFAESKHVFKAMDSDASIIEKVLKMEVRPRLLFEYSQGCSKLFTLLSDNEVLWLLFLPRFS
jgi:hypothetical protein